MRAEFEAEWALMGSTLVGTVSQDELWHCKQVDWQAIEDGQRLIFVPIFYAVGLRSGSGGVGGVPPQFSFSSIRRGIGPSG